jgi:GntR family transcriptional regulator, transcriptional repressor for pyruvate dehydrogenase complex
VLLDAQTTAEIIEARAAIETELAGLAAERITPEAATQLSDIVGQMERAVGDREQFAKVDLDFHLAIATAARNVTLARILRATQSLLHQWFAQLALEIPATVEVALEHHRAILTAIVSGDADEARHAMRRHVVEMGALVSSDDAQVAPAS